MSGDRGAFVGNIVFSETKIRRIKWLGRDTLVGTSGIAVYADDLVAYLETGALPPKEIPTDACAILIACRKGVFTMNHKMVPERVNLKVMAIGAGCEMAMGALLYGASSRRAIEIVSKYGCGASNGVDTLKL
jgi:hypothetical protein